EQGQARGQVRERLPVGEPLERLLGGEAQGSDCPFGVAGAYELLREFCRDLLGARTIGGLQRPADSRVRLRPPPREEGAVEHFAVQVVREPVPGGLRDVRPLIFTGRFNEAARACKCVTARVDVGYGKGDRGGEGRDRELLA